MNVLKVLKTSGHILFIEAIFMLLPMLVGFTYGEFDLWYAYLIPVGALLLFALLFTKLPVKKQNFYIKEGFITAGLSWILITIFGCLPFIISGSTSSFTDAIFETVSGFTTTGATIFKTVEQLPKGILFWRSLTHFLGGMGILVFMLAMLPKTSGNDIHIYRAESTGVNISKIASKMKTTAVILYVIYVSLTIIEIIMLLCGGEMNLFESVCYSFSTAGTGGFAVKNDSVMSFGGYSQTVIAVFMLLFGVNFTIHSLIIMGKFAQAFKSEELHWYIGIVFVAVLVSTLSCIDYFGSFTSSLHISFFQVASIMTTTGFTIVDVNTFNALPKIALCVVVLLMVIGSMSGSTGGGMKVSRFNILIKSTAKDLNRSVRPNKVNIIKYEGKVLNPSAIRSVRLYWVLYTVIILFSTILVTIFENGAFTLTENLTMSMSSFGNVGPALGSAYENCANFTIGSKLVFCINMLLGRLEIFPILVFILPSAWRYK